MNIFANGNKVLCVSSDGMDSLIIGNIYTVDFIYNLNEISVKELPSVRHWCKRFEMMVGNN
jgi:hypothetical protein